MSLKPFMNYFGGKWRSAPHYPPPRHYTIIEPFAGAAGYSLRYPERGVVLVEKDPMVAAVWEYLIESTSEEILKLPLMGPDDDVRDLLPDGPAQWLIRLNITPGDPKPRTTLSNFAKDYRPPWEGFENFWGEKRRTRIAAQVEFIKHWRVICGDYTESPDVEATWFIDPPYSKAGKAYAHHDIDYAALNFWCRHRCGQVIVCEQEGAGWLPFRTLGGMKATPRGGKTDRVCQEVMWHREQNP